MITIPYTFRVFTLPRLSHMFQDKSLRRRWSGHRYRSLTEVWEVHAARMRLLRDIEPTGPFTLHQAASRLWDLRTQSLRTKRKERWYLFSVASCPSHKATGLWSDGWKNGGSRRGSPKLGSTYTRTVYPSKERLPSKSEGGSSAASQPPGGTQSSQPSATPQPHLLGAALPEAWPSQPALDYTPPWGPHATPRLLLGGHRTGWNRGKHHYFFQSYCKS